MTILVVEDDPDISALLERGFALEGYEVRCAATGEAAIEQARAALFDFVILDVMLPGCSGLEVCRAIREMYQDTSIIMLSAADAVPDRIEGLTAGADDYVVKPFAFEELLARVRAQERKKKSLGSARENASETPAGLTYDRTVRKLALQGKSVSLTEREGELLTLFMEHSGHPLTRERIFETLWADQGGNAINVVDVYVGYLRRKLATLGVEPKALIKTVRGMGFLLDPDELERT